MAECEISCGMIQVSLQLEIDWQILEGAKIGGSNAASVSSVRKPLCVGTFRGPHLDRCRLA